MSHGSPVRAGLTFGLVVASAGLAAAWLPAVVVIPLAVFISCAVLRSRTERPGSGPP